MTGDQVERADDLFVVHCEGYGLGWIDSHPVTAELDRIRSLHAGIEGPWEYEVGSGNIIAEFTTDDGHDAELIAYAENSNVGAFIAAAPSTVTHLLAIIDVALNACEVIIDNADGHKPPGPPHPSREQIAALRIQRAIRAAITGGDT